MAQYDGSIRINTEIATKNAQVQLESLGNRIVKSADKVASLRSKLDALKDVQIPTQEYKEISSDISKAENQLEKLVEKQSQMQNEGKANGVAWDRLNQKIQATNEYIEYAREEMQALINEGVAFTIGNPEEEAKISQQLQYEESALSGMLEKRDLLQSKIQAQADEEQRLAEIKENATVSDQRLVDLLEQEKELLREISDLKKAGVTEGYQEYDNAAKELLSVQTQIAGIRSLKDNAEEARSSYVRLGDAIKQTFQTMARGLIDIPIAAVKTGVNGLVSGFQKLGGVAKNVAVNSFRLLGTSIKSALSKAGSLMGGVISKIKSLGTTAKKSFSTMDKSVKKSNGLFSTFASRLKGITLSLLIFNWITKAFNSFISGIKTGFSNLYTDNEKFKNSVDVLKASVLTLKNAFAAAFRPLVDVAIPYIQMAVDYMIDLFDMVGQFMAAITGQKTYTKAIRQTADAFKEAEKAAKGYLSPLDEINKYSDGESEEEDESQYGLMFEELPIEQKFKDMAEKVKGVFSDLFEPIKEAWNREGEFVIDSWKYALNEVWKLIKDIGRDFLTVWQQEATIKIFQDILHIIGDIGLIIGNLARNFREAWNENEVGLHILEKIRDILGIIVGHVRNAADATVEWSDKLDFYPLLDAFDRFLESLKPAVDAISGTLEDFYTKVILPLGTWTIEKGLPELLQVFIDFNEKVDWESLRANLAEFWEHLEPFAETVGEGLIIFIGRLSDALANFINSPEFSGFLTKVEEWMDKVTPEDVADGFQKIAIAIVALKVASAAFTGISAAFTTFSGVASVLKGVLSLLSPVISAIGGAIGGLIVPIGIVVAAVAALAAGFIYAYNTSEEFRNKVSELKDKFIEFWDGSLKPMLEEWGEKFRELWEEHIKPALTGIMEALKMIWEDALIPLAEWIVDTLLPVLLPIIDEIFNTSMDLIGELFDEIKDLADIIANCVSLIVDLLRGDWSSAWEHAGNIVETIWNGITRIIKGAVEKITGWIEGLLSLFDKANNKGSSVGGGESSQSYSSRSFSARSIPSIQSPYAANPALAALSSTPIPRLATGAVIPANREFLAVLGDQKHGTNIEAPLDTLMQANEQLLLKTMSQLGLTGGGNSNGQPIIIKWIADGKELTDLVIKNGKVYQMSSGNNPFLLGIT